MYVHIDAINDNDVTNENERKGVQVKIIMSQEYIRFGSCCIWSKWYVTSYGIKEHKL